MKPHIKLTLKADVSPGGIPYWKDVISGQAAAPSQIDPDVDKLIKQYRLPVRVTREYQPAGESWDKDERASGFNRVYRLILQRNIGIPPDLINAISVLPKVEAVSPGQVATADLPAVTARSLSRETDQRSRDAIHLPEAHEYSQGHPQITVALDTGVDLDHPELTEALLPGYDFVDIIDGAGKFVGDYLGYDEDPEDEVGHGTHVAGIIAGQGLDMPLGVVPRSKILPVRVLGAMKRGSKKVGAGLVDNINSGIKWAIDQGADVINMSLGIEHTGGGLPHEEVVATPTKRQRPAIAAPATFPPPAPPCLPCLPCPPCPPCPNHLEVTGEDNTTGPIGAQSTGWRSPRSPPTSESQRPILSRLASGDRPDRSAGDGSRPGSMGSPAIWPVSRVEGGGDGCARPGDRRNAT